MCGGPIKRHPFSMLPLGRQEMWRVSLGISKPEVKRCSEGIGETIEEFGSTLVLALRNREMMHILQYMAK